MKKTYVSFLWHFHQPYYKESVDGDFRMAWVRLHGVKDYISMATLMQEFPEMKATFNFTPSLIAQFNDYIDGTSEDFIQRICKKEITDLTYEEKCFVLDKSSPDYRRDSFEDYEEDGRVVWFERVKRKFGSGSYE